MIEIDKSFNVKKTSNLNYILNLPKDYSFDNNAKFPIILFLHGIGERGNDINLVKKYGIHRYLKDINIPFIVISPQCHSNNFWDIHFTDIEFLLKDIQKKYNADINRICLIGISLGAYGAWNFAMQRPTLFKSLVSIAGGAMLPKYASSLKDTPIFIAHGQDDKEVHITESINIYKSLKNINTKVKLKIFPDKGHELCTKIFEEKELYEWIISNT